MLEFKQYKRKETAEIAKWVEGTDMTGISIGEHDTLHGSPKAGDMIARNPKEHADKWVIVEQYFKDNFDPI